MTSYQLFIHFSHTLMFLIFTSLHAFLQITRPWISARPHPLPANQHHELYLSFFEGMALRLPVVSY